MSQKKSSAKAQAATTKLHYRLDNDEWIKSAHDLKPSELILLYHLRTIDPFGDRTLDLTVTSLAATLKMNKSTVSRALKVLDRKGYIGLELLAVQIKLRTRCLETTALPSNNTVATEQSVFPQDNQEDPVATDVASAQQERSPSNMRSLNTLLEAMSGLPQTIHTDQTVSISQTVKREGNNSLFLKDGELASEYRKWLQQRLEQLPERPIFPEQWIKAQSKQETVQKDFLNSQNAQKESGLSQKTLTRGKHAGSTPAEVFLSKKSWCYKALQVGNQYGIQLTLEELWTEGLQEVCAKICHEIPECGIEISENGPKVVRPLGEVE